MEIMESLKRVLFHVPYTTRKPYEVVGGGQHFDIFLNGADKIDLDLVEVAARDAGYFTIRGEPLDGFDRNGVLFYSKRPVEDHIIKGKDAVNQTKKISVYPIGGYAGIVLEGENHVSTCCVNKKRIQSILSRYDQLSKTAAA